MWAADPLFTAGYTGVGGGLVVVVADDPGMHSSQNEQDSRCYARAAHLPMLEPSDSDEAREFIKKAYAISEEYDTPVLVRLTTRISHSRGLVEPGQREEVPVRPYGKDVQKYVMMPGMARRRHVAMERRMDRLTADANAMDDINPIIRGSGNVGIITSGIAYQYVREAVPDASVLKLGMVYPLPMDRIRAFAESVDTLYIVEELEPLMETEIKASGIDCAGKALFTVQGEYSVADDCREDRREKAGCHGAGGAAGAASGHVPRLSPPRRLLCAE